LFGEKIKERDILKRKMVVPILCLILLVGIISGCVEEAENQGPEASFTYESDNMFIGTEFSFMDESADEDGDISSWSWDFDGDDIEDSTEQNPMYTFNEVGTYTVTLTVEDDAGATDEYSMAIAITLMDIVATAIDAGFDTLATALTAADLVTTLQDDGPFTVFAPTDEAFEALNQTWLTNLLEDVDNLTKVLTYHVVSGKVMSTDLANGSVATLEGSNITVVIDSEGVKINDVLVTTADIECNNGVIHVIGEVLLPDSVEGPTA
jgi:uncharacterized surface protein with fasciclin (FAS1) repeats